jgi:uncharacterized protein
VDADVCARAGSTIARHFATAELPRLREAGGRDGSAVEANFQFSHFEGRPTVAGTLEGVAVLTCQRCMQPVSIALNDQFQVLIVEQERSDEPGGFEPVVANPARLDLRWLAEEQALLALPLVPMHEADECGEREFAAGERVISTSEAPSVSARDESDAGTRQQPFQNLRDLLRKQ